MKNKKSMLIAFMLTAVILILSSSPVIAADIQAAYAKLPDDLLTEFDSIGSNESINVFVWIEDDSTAEYESIAANVAEPQFAQQNDTSTYSLQSVSEPELTEEERLAQIQEMQNYIMQKRLIAQAIYLEDNTAKAAEISENLSGGEVVYVSKYSPLIIYNVTKSQAVEIAMTDCVISLDRGNVELENCGDVARVSIGATSLESGGYTGQGIKIGMLEIAVPNVELDVFSDAKDKIEIISNTTTFSEYSIAHASQVAAIMVGKDTGVVRGIDKLYCASAESNTDMIQGTEDLLDSGVNVINMSFHMGDESKYSQETKWIEHIISQHSVSCVIAASNKSVNNVADIGMAYNAITVGGTNDKNTTAVSDDVIMTSNPPYNLPGSSYYGGDIYANKPDICAPGHQIRIYSDNTMILGDENYANCGTSFSAPYVTGAVAMLTSFDASLLNKPELVKSILCTSVAQKTLHNYATGDEGYKRYGSGFVNIANARVVCNRNDFVNSTISSGQTITYNIGELTAGSTITVTLSFLSNVSLSGNHETLPSSSTNLANLDIYLCDVSASSTTINIGNSMSTTNSLEKIICTVPQTSEYKIIIQRKSDGNTNSVRFAASWLVHAAALL